MASRDSILAEAIAQRKRVTAKIARLRKRGADISGTKFDTRLPASALRTMTASQLRSYIRKQTDFLSNSGRSGVVRIANGEVVSAETARKFEEAKSAFNAKAAEHFKKFSRVKLPGSSQTVGERDKAVKIKPHMGNESSNRPLFKVETRIDQFASEEAVKAKTRELQRKMKPEAYARSIKRGRRQANQMLKVIGSKNLTKFVRGLSDEEFDLAWFYGTLAENLSTRFAAAGGSDQAKSISGLDKGFRNVSENAETEILGDGQGTGGWKEFFEQFRKKNK